MGSQLRAFSSTEDTEEKVTEEVAVARSKQNAEGARKRNREALPVLSGAAPPDISGTLGKEKIAMPKPAPLLPEP